MSHCDCLQKSVWNMNWQHTAPAPAFSVSDSVSGWVSEWLSQGPCLSPGLLLLPRFCTSISHRASLAAAAAIVRHWYSQDWWSGIFDGDGHLEWFSWPLTSHNVSLILYLALGPNRLLINSRRNTLSTLQLFVTFTLQDFHYTAAKQKCVH